MVRKYYQILNYSEILGKITAMEAPKNLPQKPGMFKDVEDTVLYIGKAINLKSRVSSYFSDKHLDRPWIAVMMGLAEKVETIIVNNELEALLLESSLVKEFRPKFNIKLVDDKSYPFIQLNLNENIPRFSITRKRVNTSRVHYFGPYLSARFAQTTLELLRNLYGIHISPKALKASQKPCFYCQLSGNNCVLANEISSEKYLEQINRAVDFLKGKRTNVIDDLQEKMSSAANNMQFEVAAKLRDRLAAVEHVRRKQQIVGSVDDYDAIGYYTAANSAVIVVHAVREGRIVGQRDYRFNSNTEVNVNELISQFISSYYRTSSSIPNKLFLPIDLPNKELFENLLRNETGNSVNISFAQKGEKRQAVNLANHNAQAKLELELIKRNDAIAELIQLQELLKLPTLPQRIEAIDISNMGSSVAVGACVCFIDGQPDKNNYRRYQIKTVEGQNDFAMIKEVVARRLHDTQRPSPDVLLIDGGKQQLAFAVSASNNSPVKPGLIIGLAKKPDRVFVPKKSMPLTTPRGHKGLRLLSRIRDEVHRFGINYQRSKLRKKSLNRD